MHYHISLQLSESLSVNDHFLPLCGFTDKQAIYVGNRAMQLFRIYDNISRTLKTRHCFCYAIWNATNLLNCVLYLECRIVLLTASDR